MSYFVFKKALKKAWIWLKEHWQIPFLLVWTILVYVLTRRNTDSLIEVIEAKKESYKTQLEILRRTHNDEILKREKLVKEYQRAVKRVEEDFLKREKELSERQKEDIKEVIIRTKGSPSEVREMIEREFGIEYVE